MERDNADIIKRIAAVADPATTVDVIGEVMNAVESRYRRAKEDYEAFKAAFVEHMETTGERIVIGDMEYRAGHRYETKCIDVPAALRLLLETLDIDGAAACLSSTAMLVGACRKVLSPDAFASLFETTEKTVLVEGKPKNQLIGTNLQFAERNRQ